MRRSCVQFCAELNIFTIEISFRDHEEDFFGIERCLRCIDRGMRAQVMENIRRVKAREVKPGTWVYQPVYPRVVDRLNELLGAYNAPPSSSAVKVKS